MVGHDPCSGHDGMSMAAITDLIGVSAMLRLSVSFAGRRIYIPKPQGLRSRSRQLINAVGAEAAMALAEAWGGEYLSCVPLKPLKRYLVWKLTDEGKTASAISQELYVSERWVYHVRSQDRPDGMPLPATAIPDPLPPLLAYLESGN